MILQETRKLIAVALIAWTVTFMICCVIFVLMQETPCAMVGQHFICQKISEGIYQCVIR